MSLCRLFLAPLRLPPPAPQVRLVVVMVANAMADNPHCPSCQMIRRLLMAFIFTVVGRFDLGLRITPHFALASISVTVACLRFVGEVIFPKHRAIFQFDVMFRFRVYIRFQ